MVYLYQPERPTTLRRSVITNSAQAKAWSHSHHPERQLCLFVSFLASQKLCHSTIKCYLAAVRHLHIAEGFGDPLICDMARLEQVLKGVKSVQSKEPLRRTTRLPITHELLAKLRGIWVSQPDGSMLWAAASLCFFGFLRSGEITVPSDSTFDERAHLSFKDVAVDSFQEPRQLKVRIKASKTDPFRLGVDIFVGITDNSLCPVTAVLGVQAQAPSFGLMMESLLPEQGSWQE
jgi:hypothetical protein